MEYFSAWRPILGARSGEVESAYLCHEEDSYSFSKKVDTTSRSSITKIMPYIEKFGYNFIWFCDILSLLVIKFDWCQRTLRIKTYVMLESLKILLPLIELEMPVVKSPVTCCHPQVKIWLNSFRGEGEVPLTLLPSPCLFSDNSLLSVSHKNLIIQIYENARLRGIFTCIV